MVDTTPPEITDAYAEVIGQKAKITAKVADITQPYVYADITYLKGDKSYHTETELVKAEDSYTAEYEFDRKEICRKITIIAIDEAGNKSSADAYEKSEQELMYPLPMISFGNDHGALVKEDRSLWTWGDNGYGQLGVKYAPEGVPQKIMDNVIQVSCRRDTSAAVTADGVLYMWGYNGYGNFGNNSYSNSSQPVRIMDNVAQVVCGEFCTAAITRDGSLYMWGYNDFGQIGDGTTADKATPVKIMDNVKQVSIGARHCAAVTTDGIMYAWGDNDYYQFGNWSRESSLVPVKIMSKVESISLGAYHSAAVTEDGSLYIWGYNNKGQLGTGTTQSSAGPVKILDNVAKIFMEQNTSSAVTDDGTLYMWGSNPNGILGQGSEERILLPAAIMENTAQAAVGTTFAGLLKTDGSLWLTGENYSGQLGDTDADDRTQFEELPMTAFSKLVISASEAEMYVGETLQLTANLEGEKIPEGASFSWSSMDTSVVEVDSHGLVKAVGTGATYIKVSCNNKEEMCWITVSRRPTVIIAKTVAEMESSHDYNDDECSIWVYTFSGAKSLKVTFSEETYVENHYDYLDIYDGDDNLIDFYTGYELAGKTITVDGDTVKVKLTSDSSGTDYGFKVVSIVNEKGAAAPGSENVPVTNPTVTAAPKPTAVPVPTKKPAGPSVCSSHSFGAWTVTKKATVMEAGTKSRTCRICNYTEKQTIAKLKPTIKLTATKIPLKVKQSTTKLKVSGLAAGDKVVSWKSKNTKIVKVNSKGKLTAQKKTGKTTVTVTLASGLKKNITVTVQKGNVKTTKISGLSKKITLKKGKKLNLKPVITPITSLEKVTYSSSNNKIVSVDKKGKLTAKKAGSAKITVKSGKKKFVITVTVPKK